jgi:hypothetical protein
VHRPPTLTIRDDRGEKTFEASDDFAVPVWLRCRNWQPAVGVRFRGYHFASPTANLRDASERVQVIGRGRQYFCQLRKRFVKLPEIEKRAAKCGAGGKVFGVQGEAGAADGNGLLHATGASKFLGEWRKCERRRILLDPASKIVNPFTVRHRDSLMQASVR